MQKILNSLAPILLTGESGAGKSYWATHLAQKREVGAANVTYVDLAAVSDSLFLSELYGHVKGAFTGALCDKKGLCEITGNGSLILDEIGELSLDNQKHLLSFLDRREFRAVGSNHPKPFRGKVIATTNKNLKKMVEQGSFRFDLYHRLYVFHYRIPSFRERSVEKKEEILVNVQNSIKTVYCLKAIPILDDLARSLLWSYQWPGNVRQLRNFCEFITWKDKHHELEPEELRRLLDEFLGSCEGNHKVTCHFQIGVVPYH